MKIDKDTWIISDTHFGHKNIIKYCGRPVNHNELIMENWRKLIKPEDVVLHLGDLTVWYGEKQKLWEDAAKALPGQKLLILGNHDKRKASYYTRGLGYKVIKPFVWRDILFNHYPEYNEGDCTKTFNTIIHGHVHNNQHRKIRRIGNIDYMNVSIEVMDYKPVRLGTLIDDKP